MQTRWRVYWASLGAAVFGLSVFVNWRRDRKKGWLFLLGKAACETALVAVLAAYCPALLTALCVMWVADQVTKNGVWKTVVSVLAGIGLGALGGVFLEALLILGAFAMHIVTGEFLNNWKLRGQKNGPQPVRKTA